ncbi:MAG: hypothetical protein QF748_00175, partial [Candidatus Pacebacteria bacterium]|nr:hypothetical protein [Candidatus Paceibacterota bacterium]
MAKETYYGEINFERVGDGRMVHIDFLLHDTLGLMGTESLPAGADGESADGKKLVVLIKTAPERLTVYDVQVHIST